MNTEPAFPALPITRDFNGEMLYQAKGITIRDYFAAKAMQGLYSRVNWSVTDVAQRAYEQADAMLKAREQ